MQECWSYIKDTEDFLKKVQNMGKTPQDSILVTADGDRSVREHTT